MAGKRDGLRECAVGVAACLCVALFILWQGCPTAFAEHVADPIYDLDANITTPEASTVWLAGSDHTVTCGFEDKDCNLDTGKLDDDGVICTWSGASGTFKGGCVGKSVVYVCLDTSGADWVEVIGLDEGVLAPDYWEPAYDSVTFTTVIPEVIEVNFQLASEAYNLKTHNDNDDTVSSSTEPEYVRTVGAQNPTNHSATFLKDSPLSLKFKLEASQPLTEGTGNITVKYAYGALAYCLSAEADSQTFGIPWPYASDTMTSSQKFRNCINYEDDCTNRFSYKVTSGSNNWILLSPQNIYHNLCIVAKAPANGPHYEWVARASCRMAWYQDSDDVKTIVDDIFDSLKDYACVNDWSTKLMYYGDGTDTRSLLRDTGHAGMCNAWGKYFADLCYVQGLTSAQVVKRGFHVWDARPGIEYLWIAMIVTKPGINRTSVQGPEEVFRVASVYPYPEFYGDGACDEDDVVPLPSTWYVFGTPEKPDGHSLVFVQGEGGTNYMYDPVWGAGPKANVYPAVPVHEEVKVGDQNSSFCEKWYNNDNVEYHRGNPLYKYGVTDPPVQTTLAADVNDLALFLPAPSTRDFTAAGWIAVDNERIRYSRNKVLTNLNGNHTAGVTTLTVDATTGFPDTGTAVIGTEEIIYTGKTGTTLTGCTRGANGTTAAPHNDRSDVAACGFNVLLAEWRGDCGSTAAGHDAGATIWGIDCGAPGEAAKWLTVHTDSFPVTDLRLQWRSY